jgi:hypothetical protein
MESDPIGFVADRTKKAEDVVNQAFLASMVGLIYIGVFLVFIFVGSSV